VGKGAIESQQQGGEYIISLQNSPKQYGSSGGKKELRAQGEDIVDCARWTPSYHEIEEREGQLKAARRENGEVEVSRPFTRPPVGPSPIRRSGEWAA